MTSDVRRLVVVGGGLAGLAAAHRVRERAPAWQLVLVEAGERIGGSIGTERVNGFLVETGADSILTEKPWGLDLCRRLGLEDRLIRTRDEERRTFVVRNGKLVPLPEGFLLMAPTELWPVAASPLFSPLGKLRMALDLVLPRGPARDDESLASFVGRRFGREALDRVVQPLVGGIYTADPERLSLAATMPRFLEMERRDRSVILGMRKQARAAAAKESGARWSLFASFTDGMQTLIDALAQRLPEGALRLRTPVRSLAPRPGGGWRLALGDGTQLDADAVVLATPSFVTADLLRPLDAGVAALLAGIDYASSAIVTLGYARAEVPHPLDGFGFVVPAVERRMAIAGSFTSVKYAGRAPAGQVLLRVFLGGALAAPVVDLDDGALLTAARRELAELLGVTAPPSLTRVQRHRRAMPQYAVGHLERVAAIEAGVARLGAVAVAGSAYRGVGVPDCIHSGERAVDDLLEARR